MKYSFKNDYSEGCHPKILEALSKSNDVQQAGYSLDDYCKNAENLILTLCDSPQSKVHFVSGGTQANLIIISAALRPHESVIASDSGHIFVNETAAIEATGHKVNSIISDDGKIYPQQVLEVLDAHSNVPHQVKPKMVYISNSTEIGTIYSKEDLENLSEFCKSNNLLLFIDGARLGHALTAETNDLTLKDIARLTDVFYIGGTKNGALLGEAIVINNPALQEDFGFHIKQKGGMLAKSRILGIQFEVLMKDNLYFQLAEQANRQAMKIKKSILNEGHEILSETFTNQIFPIFKNTQIEKLQNHFDFYIWKKIDEERAAIRLITSWAAPDKAVENIIAQIKRL